MLLVAVVVGAVGAFIAIPPKRVLHWSSFAPLWCGVGVIATFVAVTAVAFLSIVAAYQVLGERDLPFYADFAIAAGGVSALRRGSAKDPGASLVLGTLPVLFNWIGELVQPHVLTWVRQLSDSELVASAARADDVRRGTEDLLPFKTVVRWMQEAIGLLSADPATHDATRLRLEYHVADAYQTYLVMKS